MGSSIRITAVWPLFVFVAFLAMAGWTSDVLALDDETTSSSLTGLQGIVVMVPLIPDAERDGLKSDQIQTEVEMRLRKAGIKIMTESERLKIPDFPILKVNVNAVKDKNSELHSYEIKIELYKQFIQNAEEELTPRQL